MLLYARDDISEEYIIIRTIMLQLHLHRIIFVLFLFKEVINSFLTGNDCFIIYLLIIHGEMSELSADRFNIKVLPVLSSLNSSLSTKDVIFRNA